MIRFINEHRDQFEIDAICPVLRVTECGFVTSRIHRAANNKPASALALRDGLLREDLKRIHAANYSICGARKMHQALRRAEWGIGRDQVAWLIKTAGLGEVVLITSRL